MVCRLSELEAAVQCRTGQLSRRADRLTGVNSTGCGLIQTSHLPQCSKNRWLMLIYHTQPCSRRNAHTNHQENTLPQRQGCICKRARRHWSISMDVYSCRHSNWGITNGYVHMQNQRRRNVHTYSIRFKLHITYEVLLLCTLTLKYNTHSSLSKKMNAVLLKKKKKKKTWIEHKPLKWCLEPIWMQTWSCQVECLIMGPEQWQLTMALKIIFVIENLN